MNKIILLIAISTVLVLSACGSSKRVVVAQQQKLPSWYTTVPQNTKTDLYSIGYGQNKQDAITDALTQMISTLGVSVSSKFSSKTVTKEGSIEGYNATFTNSATSEVKQIRISNYELLEAKNLGYKKYAVLVKSNKEKLFMSLKQEIEQKFYTLHTKEHLIKKQNMLKQLQFYKDGLASFSLLENKLIVMHELDPDFDTSVYLDKYTHLEMQYDMVYKNIHFSFHSNHNAKNLEPVLAKGLSRKKLRISSTRGKGHFKIYLTSIIEKAESYGFILARSGIVIEIKDYKGNIIGSNRIALVGQSTQGFAIAKQNIAIKLEALIKKEGIFKVLGISI